MARPVKVRERYTTDRSRLVRLEEAVEKDGRLFPAERDEVRLLLHRLCEVLITIDDRIGVASALRRSRAPRRKAA